MKVLSPIAHFGHYHADIVMSYICFVRSEMSANPAPIQFLRLNANANANATSLSPLALLIPWIEL